MLAAADLRIWTKSFQKTTDFSLYVAKSASLRELHRVFSITSVSEQDFYSKPFSWSHFSSFALSLWKVWECFIQSLHIYPTWVSYVKVISHGIAEAGSDCWWPSSRALLSSGLTPKGIPVSQGHVQVCLELLRRTHLQGWSFLSLRAAPLTQWILSPLMSS